MLKPSKSPSKSLNNNNKKKRTNFNRASHLRCSGPNNRTNFNRASHLRCSGPNNKKKRTNFNRASHLRCSGPNNNHYNFNRASHLRCSGPNNQSNNNRASHLRCSGPNNQYNNNRASHLRCSGPNKGNRKQIWIPPKVSTTREDFYVTDVRGCPSSAHCWHSNSFVLICPKRNSGCGDKEEHLFYKCSSHSQFTRGTWGTPPVFIGPSPVRPSILDVSFLQCEVFNHRFVQFDVSFLKTAQSLYS